MKQNIKPIVRLGSMVLLAVSAALTARADYPSTVLSQGAPVYYQLNETVQPAPTPLATNIGSLGSAANGTYVSLPEFNAPGPFTGSVAVGLDGAAQYIDTPTGSGIDTPKFTVELWANPATIPKFAYLASSCQLVNPRSGWYLAQDDGSTFAHGSAWVLRTFYQKTFGTTGVPMFEVYAPVVPGWTHIAVTFDGTTAIMYTNGVVALSTNMSFATNAAAGGPIVPLNTLTYVPNAGGASSDFTVGCRSTLNFFWPGKVAEVAVYSNPLTQARLTAHYSAATGAPSTYASTVLADTPLLYDRYQAPPNATIVNSGTLGSAYNGLLIPDARAASPGPVPPTYPGFGAANKSIAFDALGGAGKIPALNFNTNTVTICAWVNATNSQYKGAGIVVCDSGATGAGLIIDNNFAGLGLGYYWNNDSHTANWSPSADSGLPALPDSDWAFVALVIQPTEADIYIASPSASGPIPFTGATNYYAHINQAFAGPTLIGTDAGTPTLSFKGAIDEVGMWNRALSSGELYTQYGAAVGSLAPVVFGDPPSPSQPIVAGDTLALAANVGGTPILRYQWRQNGTNIPAPLGTNVVYSKPNFSIAGDSGNYDLIVTNNYGAVTTGVAVVTGQLATAPVILARPISRTLYPGGSLNLSVVATGGGLIFQWKTNGTPIPGATSASYSVPSVTITNAGSYTVTVTNLLGATNLGPFVITIPTFATNSYEGLIIAAAPEAWWRLDEPANSTNLFDGMGRHDGYYANVSNTVPPVTLGVTGLRPGNTTASFNANGGVGVIPYSATLNGSKHTYEGWVKTTDLSHVMAPYSSTYGGSGVFWAEVPVGNWTPDTATGYYPISPLVPIVSGVWTHLAMTYDSSIVSGGTAYPLGFYINGQNISGGSTWSDNSGLNSGGPIIIGGHGVDATKLADLFFNGLVDEVAVYPRVLSVAEITNHFVAGFPATPPVFNPQPVSQAVFLGQSVTFSVTANGSQPILLQWKKNGVSIPGQTNSSLTLSDLYYTASSDIYTVTATNSAGSALSSNASVTVYYPPTFANLTNGLVLHLPFDGNYADTSGRGNNGVSTGTTIGTGKIGSGAVAYQTTTVTNYGTYTNIAASSSTYVDLGTGYGVPGDLQFGSSASFSISLWVKLPSGYTGGDLPFIGTGVGSMNNPGWDLGPTYGTGGWQWCLNDGVQTQAVTNNIDVSGAASSINDGNWHNFVLTVNRSANLATSYLDGTPVGSRDITGLASLDNGHLVTIGQDPTYGYPNIAKASQNDLTYFNGPQTATLDDIGIWRRALTDYEARSIYVVGQNYGKSFNTFGPVVVNSYSLPGGMMGIAWQSGTLKQSSKVTGPWTPVPGATPPFYQFTPPTTNNMFYGVGP